MEFVSFWTPILPCILDRLDPGTLEVAFGVPKTSMFMMDSYGPSVEKMYTQKV